VTNGSRIERFESGAAPPAEFAELRGIPGAPGEPVAPGTECLLLRVDGRAAARCSLHAADDLHGAPGRSGMVGHYEARDAAAGTDLLRHACALLFERGAARVLAPMNGSTWVRYRLALPRTSEEARFAPETFPGEPRNPDDYPAHFEAAGLGVVARYESRIEPDLAREPPDVAAVAARCRERGFRLRSIDLARWDAELDTLFALSLEAFAGNLFYAPIGALEFRSMYAPLRPRLDPDLVLVAEDAAGRPCGFQLSYADPAAPSRVVVKTTAVAPAARGAGLGHHMLDVLRERALARGFRSALHALMQVDNRSMRISSRQHSDVFRRYALYQALP
jgi:ribosomal protein S18 acetylase RimI-like enzyme